MEYQLNRHLSGVWGLLLYSKSTDWIDQQLFVKPAYIYLPRLQRQDCKYLP